jgi:hypothetical protein
VRDLHHIRIMGREHHLAASYLSNPLSTYWCSFRPDLWARFRLESIAMDKP